jgi:hypothetical protein
MSTTTELAPGQIGSGGWKDAVVGVAFLMAVGTAFIGLTALVAALFAGH